jgi:pilus assembly protein CpaF
MSLLKRIERARPAADGEGLEVAEPPNPNAPMLAGTPDAGPANVPTAPRGGQVVPPPPAPTTGGNRSFLGSLPARESFREAKYRVQNRLINELDPKLDLTNMVEVRQQIEELFAKIADEEGLALTRAERVRMLEQITDEILGLGPLEPLLRDETLTEVMVNGPQQVYIEREGKLELTNVTFQNDEHVMKVIQRIISPIGRRIDESSPMVDARLPDGSRVNAIIPPLSLVGPVITIRKFSATPFTVNDLVRFGTATPEMFEFLEACVKARLNIFVSGGTGSGKTTTLNILSSFIPDDERIVTIEDAAELQLRQEHVVTLESRPANIEGKGAIAIRELVRNALRMRPDRIVVGECRSAEALDMLQAMNTGHDGSMSTGHANSPRDMLSRLETMVMMTGMELPLRAIREQIASAVDVIVHQGRLKDGSRRITHITEVQGMEGDVVVMQDIFVFEQTGFIDGKIQGRLKPTGIRPKFIEKFEVSGIHLPPNTFGTPY